jgi:hypothetical protein
MAANQDRAWLPPPQRSTELPLYKKDPPLAGTKDTPQEIHYCPLLYLRVGSSVVGS